MKQIFTLMLLILMLSINNCFSQDIEKHNILSDSLSFYNKLIKGQPDKAINYYKRACLFSKLDSNNQAIGSIISAITYNIKYEYILADTDSDNLRELDEWRKVDSTIIRSLKLKDSVQNVQFAYFLLKAGVIDQKFRSLRKYYKLNGYPKNYD